MRSYNRKMKLCLAKLAKYMNIRNIKINYNINYIFIKKNIKNKLQNM